MGDQDNYRWSSSTNVEDVCSRFFDAFDFEIIKESINFSLENYKNLKL